MASNKTLNRGEKKMTTAAKASFCNDVLDELAKSKGYTEARNLIYKTQDIIDRMFENGCSVLEVCDFIIE